MWFSYYGGQCAHFLEYWSSNKRVNNAKEAQVQIILWLYIKGRITESQVHLLGDTKIWPSTTYRLRCRNFKLVEMKTITANLRENHTHKNSTRPYIYANLPYIFTSTESWECALATKPTISSIVRIRSNRRRQSVKGSRRHKVSVNCKANILHEAKEHTNQLKKGDEADDTQWCISDISSSQCRWSFLALIPFNVDRKNQSTYHGSCNGDSKWCIAWHLPCSL